MSDESSEPSSGPLAFLLALPALGAWIGLPTLIFGFLWMLVLVVARAVLGITVPTVTFGVFEALGAPATVNGVPSVLLALAGLFSTGVWFALFGGGSRPDFDSAHRSGGWDR